MKYYVIKDGTIIAETTTKEAAIALIRTYQAQERHFIRAEFSVIEGEPQVFIKYLK